MKILLVTATYKPSINGISIALENTSRKLRELGHTVYILAPEHKKAPKNEKYIIRYPAIYNPKKFDYPIPLLPVNLKDLKKLWKIDLDIVHAQHPFHIFTMADIISKLHNCPSVFTFHTNYDLYMDIYLKMIPKKVNKIWLENTIERIGKKADLIIAPSKMIKNRILNTYPKANVKVLTTGVETNKKILKRKKAKEILNWPKEKTCLLCVGRLSKEKNLETAILSLKHLPENYILYLVGDGPYKKDLVKMVSDENLSDRVYFIGEALHNKTYKYYNAADMFLMPSVTETQGLVIFEAAAMHAPIAAVKSDVSLEFLDKSISEISKNDPKSLADAVVKLSNRNFKEIEKNLAKWISRFSFEKYVEKLINLYQDLG